MRLGWVRFARRSRRLSWVRFARRLPPVADLEAARRYGWQVARPDAYPEVFHKERGLSMRPPLVWELELIEGCLRTVPDFVTRHKQDDPIPEEATVSVASGPLRLVLSWVVDD